MNVYKAYQNLFKKTLNYKDELDQYKKLDTGSSITAGQMSKLVEDQQFVMNMIDKMQDELADRNIINNSEKVPVSPVANIPQNIDHFNNTARSQIKTIISRNSNITPSAKQKIENLILNPTTKQAIENCGCNRKFIQSGGQLIILKNNKTANTHNIQTNTHHNKSKAYHKSKINHKINSKSKTNMNRHKII